ncbi:MAG TPA: IS110 family transposase [Vicinamibacterales bacterium]|nr:IS110 family transposase [Vicinamibacterales bacterium]
MAVVGIDVAKAKLAVVLLGDEGKPRHKSCPNTPAGHTELVQWLRRHAGDGLRVGVEATGGYQDAVALALHDAGHQVSVINPAAIAAYGQSQLRRANTDPTDAALIADFVRTQQPSRWIPAPPETRQLQALVRRLDALLEMQTQETHRLELAAAIVRPSIDASLAHLAHAIADIKRQIARHIDQFPTLRAQRDLILTIPGIGERTAALVLGEILDVARFTSARQLAAYAGLVPHVRQSGTSVRGRGALTKIGAPRLRKALYWPAITASKHNPPLRGFAARLRAAGKPKMVIVAAIMRKLLHQIYGVLRSGRRFDPTIA